MYINISAERTIKSLVTFSDSYAALIEKIKMQDVKIDNHTELIEAESQKQIADSISTLSIAEETRHKILFKALTDMELPMARIERQLRHLQAVVEETWHANILSWLSTVPFIQHHDYAKRDVLAGTGEWFLKNDGFMDWCRSSTSSIFWLHSIPGSGKSKLLCDRADLKHI